MTGAGAAASTALLLDSAAFAPAPRSMCEAAARSRPGIDLISTRTGVVRIRRTGSGPTVVVLEIPGFGYSWATDRSAVTFEGTVEACIAVLRHLGVDSAVLAGSCVQAHVALAIATRRPDLARDLSDWQRRAVRLMRDGGSNSLASLLQGWLDGPVPTLGPVTVPTVLLWGTADRTHARFGTDPGSLLDSVTGAELQVWEDAGHFLDIEQPSRSARALGALS